LNYGFQVVWQFNAESASKHSAKENAYQVITLSSDGRILIWNWLKMDNPVFGYELVSPHPKTKRLVVWGGTAMAFHSNISGGAEDQGANASSLMSANHGTFVVGTDGGTVYRCMFQHNAATETEFSKHCADKSTVKFRTPIKGEYTAHAGDFNIM
jgi:ribulose-5-phosphate 4-epimerase/fuculose-1-phosphate aldolase